MVEAWAEKRVVISPDPSSLADSVAARFLSRIAKRVDEGKPAHVSLTGGSMGSAVLAAAAKNPRVERIDWSRVHFWWSDERFVPAGHADRNDQQARTALLDSLGLPAANVHAPAASDEGLELDDAAEAYAAELARFAGVDGPWPSFDVCFLGVGPDGHIASLFPDRPEILITTLRAAQTLHPDIESPLRSYFQNPLLPAVLGFDPRLQFLSLHDTLAILTEAVVKDRPGTFNAAGPGVMLLSQAARRLGKPTVPLPPIGFGAAAARVVRGMGGEMSPDLHRLLTHGRALDLSALREIFG